MILMTEVPSSPVLYDCIILTDTLISFLPPVKEEMLLYSFFNVI